MARATSSTWASLTPGTTDRVYLDGDAPRLQSFNGADLPIEQQFRAPYAPVYDFSVPDPTVDLLPDPRIDGIDGYGDMGNADFGDLVEVVCHSEPVGRKTQKHLRKLFSYEAQRLHRLPGVGKRVSGAGDSGDRDFRFVFEDFFHIPASLRRGKNGAGHARPALIDTVVLAVAVVAPDIAMNRNRQMNAAVGTFGGRIETWMSAQIARDVHWTFLSYIYAYPTGEWF